MALKNYFPKASGGCGLCPSTIIVYTTLKMHQLLKHLSC